MGTVFPALWTRTGGAAARRMPKALGTSWGSVGKESAAMRETWVQFLGQEDPLERGMATAAVSCLGSSMEEPGRIQSTGS